MADRNSARSLNEMLRGNIDTITEGIVNSYFGAVGSHPALKGLKGVAPSLFGLGGAAAIAFDIDEYADAYRNGTSGDIAVQVVGTAGGISGAYYGGLIGSAWGGGAGGLPGAIVGGLLGSAFGAYYGEDAVERLARDLSNFSTSYSTSIPSVNQGWHYTGTDSLTGEWQYAPKYTVGINNNGTSWGLDSPSEHIHPADRARAIGLDQGSAGISRNPYDVHYSAPTSFPDGSTGPSVTTPVLSDPIYLDPTITAPTYVDPAITTPGTNGPTVTPSTIYRPGNLTPPTITPNSITPSQLTPVPVLPSPPPRPWRSTHC